MNAYNAAFAVDPRSYGFDTGMKLTDADFLRSPEKAVPQNLICIKVRRCVFAKSVLLSFSNNKINTFNIYLSFYFFFSFLLIFLMTKEVNTA